MANSKREKGKELVDSIVNDWFPAHVDEFKAYVKSEMEAFLKESDDISYTEDMFCGHYETYKLSEMGIAEFMDLLYGWEEEIYRFIPQIITGDLWLYGEVVEWVLKKKPALKKLDAELHDYYVHAMIDIIPDFNLEHEMANILDKDTVIDLIGQNPNYAEMVKNYYHDIKQKQLLCQYVMEREPESYADLFPLARCMKRHFIIHSGPTNSGKTYDALEALKAAESGLYLAPLRLLAIEVHQALNDDGVPCSLVTGEECVAVEGAQHRSSTVEMLDSFRQYDVAVIDEAQMIGDSQRGDAWTNAIMGVCAETIHICTSPDAVSILCKVIEYCGDTYELIEHTRNTPLILENEDFTFPVDVRKGDALVVFSKRSVQYCAAELQAIGKSCSVVYGALPYDVRKNEVNRFLNSETDVIVATDAIGMGLNLPIKRVVFLETSKFDGVTRRKLNTSEIKQIAGRAGRRGIYDEGLVNAEFGKGVIQSGLNDGLSDVNYAVIGFPNTLLFLDCKLSEAIGIWNEIPSEGFFVKRNMERELNLAQILERDSDDKLLISSFINMPFSENNYHLMSLWKCMFDSECHGQKMDFSNRYSYIPEPKKENLQELEKLYQELDLVYYYLRACNHDEDLDRINELRNTVSQNLIKILTKDRFSKRTCKYCKTKLPWNYPYGMCEKCYDSQRWY